MIIDDIVRGLSVEEQQRFGESFKAATFVNVQNVQDYLIQHYNVGDEIDSLQDFPNCTPPWDESVFLWKYNGVSTAVLVSALTVDDFIAPKTGAVPEETTWKDYIKWVVDCFLFTSPFNESSFFGHVRLFLDGRGHFITGHEGRTLRCQVERGRGYSLEGQTSNDVVANQILSYMTPVFLGISFCHCKNVALQKHDLPHRLARARIKKNHTFGMSYYTLDIKPMTTVLADSAQPGTSLQKRLYICRGHFKDYRQGGGLFGKQKGLYWWDMTVRGNAKQGVIAKDYRVIAPRKEVCPD